MKGFAGLLEEIGGEEAAVGFSLSKPPRAFMEAPSSKQSARI